ncbi:MAG: GtrA family protein [Bifidobacteriaceae bacterium]|nr:GtrA family protein [Bifidobacteriaceae bacterium]
MGVVEGFFHKVTRWPFIRQVLLYGLFGLTAAGVDFGLFRLLRQTGMTLLVANVVSVNVGIAISFVCNAFLNFRRTDTLARRALTFFCVGWAGLALSSAILAVGVQRMDLDETWVKAASIVVVAAFQFTLNKFVTFRVAKKSLPDAPPHGISSLRPDPPRGPRNAPALPTALPDPGGVPAISTSADAGAAAVSNPPPGACP